MLLYNFLGFNKYIDVGTFLLIWYCNVANGVTITTKSNNKTVLSGTKLELEWTVNVSPGDTSILISVFLSPDFTNAILVDGSVKEKSLKLFGKNRLSATFENLTYTMSLMDVKYNESGTFRLDVVFRNNGLKDTQSDTYVSVTGSSSFCDINLECHHTVNESQVLTVVPEVCGYPIPKLKWKVGDDDFSTAASPSVINNATRQYEYSFKTRPVTRKDCGRNLTLVTSNTIGSMERNAKIDVKFVPSMVSLLSSYRYNTTCVRVTWDGEDTGKCILNYHLQFSGRETIYNTSNTYFTLCNATDVASVTIWASYNTNVEENLTTTSSPDITSTTNSTTTLSPDITSTPNMATTNAVKCVQRTCDCQSTSNITVSIVVTLAVTLILVIIIFTISKQKGYITVSKSRNRPPQIYKNRSTGNYKEAESTISHNSDIDAKAMKYICRFDNDD